MASASPIASAAAVEAVGARFNEHASSFTAMSRTMSLALASVERILAVRAISRIPIRFTDSRISTSSSVSPLAEIASSTSSDASAPRSPCNASAAWRKIEGVPVLENVADIFRPIRPDFPIPVTTTRPSHAYKSSTALSNRSSSRSINPAIASASIRRTRFAEASADFAWFA